MKNTETRTRLLGLALPNVLANLTVPLAGLVDTAILGHLPQVSILAGVGLASVIFDFIWALFGFLRMGTTSLVAQGTGAGNPAAVTTTAVRAALLGLVAGTLIAAFSAPIGEGVFGLLSGGEDVKTFALAYYQMRILAAPMALLNFALLGTLLGQSRGKAVMGVAMVTHLTNIVLDIVFVSVLGWGAAGAGLATAASQSLGALVAVVLCWSTLRAIPTKLATLFDPKELRALFALNADIVLRTLALNGTFITFTNTASAVGPLALASTTVLLKFVSLGSWFIDGFAFATEAIAGEATGKGDSRGLKELLKVGLPWGVGLGLVFATVLNAVPELTLSLLTDQPEVLSLCSSYAPWLFPVMGFGGAAYILDGYFIGRSDGPAIRNSMLISALLGFLPLALYAYFTASLTLLWAALAAFMLARGLTLGRKAPATFTAGVAQR